MGGFVVAVDVGTGSARAGVFDRKGQSIARAAHPIRMSRHGAKFAEHSSADIWNAVVASVRDAVAASGIAPEEVDAIGFDATCSLVFLDSAGRPVSIALDGDPAWDTIAWLDHRASGQAAALSERKSEALDYSGGVISPEMQMPKLMWVRDRLPQAWANAGLVLDLADYLTFRATGNLTRSACTLTAKWSYLNHKQAWDATLLNNAGLSELESKTGISGAPCAPGQAIGALSGDAAKEMGLREGSIVAAGMVDAYAGALALTGTHADDEGRVSLIGGTSSCVMRFVAEPQFLKSYWGPYYGAALPDRWILEGGQSAAGALLDHILRSHLGREPTTGDHANVVTRIEELYATEGPEFGRHIHVLPDFHGNRTPFGDASQLGTVMGLQLDGSFDGLAALYYRTKVALALGIRQIIETMEQGAQPIRALVLGGGHAKSMLFRQLYADATGRDVILSAGDEAMLLGTAMTAAAAAGWHSSLEASCRAWTRGEQVIKPNPANTARFERDYRVLIRMQEHRREIADMG